MSDEGFHEIQLNGKQLVFLFMAATVVSVVIFLCGVMVGRGVRAQQPGASDLAATLEEAVQPPAPAPASAPEPAAAQPPAAGAPPEPAEGYYAALTDDKDKAQALTPPAAPREEPKPAEKVAVEAAPAPPRAAPAAPPSSVTSGEGFVVQVAALRDRTEADTLVRRLSGKGYSAFVVNPVPGTPPVYKVQVGRFAERAEAVRVSARLKAEEQFSPWVTR
jgi:cell division septation protein DedD